MLVRRFLFPATIGATGDRLLFHFKEAAPNMIDPIYFIVFEPHQTRKAQLLHVFHNRPKTTFV